MTFFDAHSNGSVNGPMHGQLNGQLNRAGGHSATVLMTLRFGSIVLPVAQVGGGRIVLPMTAAADLPAEVPTTGELTVDIDGAVQRWEVTVEDVERADGAGPVVVGGLRALAGGW